VVPDSTPLSYGDSVRIAISKRPNKGLLNVFVGNSNPHTWPRIRTAPSPKMARKWLIFSVLMEISAFLAIPHNITVALHT
jgi:hypothetical protein